MSSFWGSLHRVTFFIRGDNHQIQIGKGCKFNRGGEIWFEDNSGSLIVGQYSTFENVHIAVTEPGSKVFIGEHCMFAYDVDVRTGDSHSIINLDSGQRINFAQDIYIGDHIWVAAHTIILKGVSIAAHSVIATGSVVTGKHDEEGVILAGNPAKIVKRHITWTRERSYKSVGGK